MAMKSLSEKCSCSIFTTALIVSHTLVKDLCTPFATHMQYFIRSCPELKLTTQVFEVYSIFSYTRNYNATFKEINIIFTRLAVITLVVGFIHIYNESI